MKFKELSKEHKDNLIYLLDLEIERFAEEAGIEGELIYPSDEEYEEFFDNYDKTYRINEEDGYPVREYDNDVKFDITFDENNKVELNTYEEDIEDDFEF
ncbi:hypothetical protein UMC2_08091 [[Clostridium] sordellii]|uniref:hypothetical protein n=1 Tax=Paraclostridium sordellii TaxID=1505 RepID=UPI0005432CD7|nr:hypothetical protein [Paeniclostridium sordellii]CEK33559.1 hypothetical protein UMC2_08091 [[Clostridium] sordellii] [Paeniclostridium sordellii]